MTARGLALAVGIFYLLTGGWAFLFPTGFYSIVANLTPYNLHLLHDIGAFQVGLGTALLAAAVAGRGLAPIRPGKAGPPSHDFLPGRGSHRGRERPIAACRQGRQHGELCWASTTRPTWSSTRCTPSASTATLPSSQSRRP